MPNLPHSVPHRRQERYGFCLPACVEMVLAYYGINRSQRSLAVELGVIEDVGAPVAHVKRLAGRHLVATSATGEESDLLELLEWGVPPIVAVDTRQLPYWEETSAHAIVLAGVTGESSTRLALIHDPAFPQPVTVSLGDLLLAWDDLQNVYAVVRPVHNK